MDGHRVCGGVRSYLGVGTGATRVRTHGVWRHLPEPNLAVRNRRRDCEYKGSFPEGSPVLGAAWPGDRHMARLATHVDVCGSLPATRSA